MISAKDRLSSSEEEGGVLVAGVIYILMKRTYHISRNVRAQWFLQNLNNKISISQTFVNDLEPDLLVLSVVPQDPPQEWKPESSHLYQYLVTSSSSVVFLSEIYRTVYCLDMSPSISAVDIQHGQVMIDEIVDTLSKSLRGIVRPFVIPGSCIDFEPDIFVTVIVHTPFYTTPAQQVLVQGWQVTPENLDEFLSAIQKQLQLLEDTIAEVSALAYDQLEEVRMRQLESEKLVGGLFEEMSEKQVHTAAAEIAMVSPDLGFINLLRYGMLALRLLPPSSFSNLIVVTDGMITLPDIHVLDSVLTQLRTNAVAVSFLHVGSQFHPHCSQGLVPYAELMQFIACATFGAYIPASPSTGNGKDLNIYHEAFLTWSFKKGSSFQELTTPLPRFGEWNVSNQSFYGNREPQLLSKKQVEDNLNACLSSILCCRLREGFMIRNVYLKENQLDVCLVLPWANHIYIEYVVSCQWPLNTSANVVHYAISIKAPYEFLHDITCLMKKQFQSPYRQAVVSRFWSTLKTLGQSDLLLAHLDSFAANPASYVLPESIRSGMPLFYLPSSTGSPVLSSSDQSCLQFAHFWRHVCLLDPSVWHKWLHTHSLSLILQHDLPLPSYLHTASPNGRFQSIQSRHAAAALYNFLKDWMSFVLIENHSYLKFVSVGDTDKTPSWFYIVRVMSKPPCAVIHIAFLGGTPGRLRYQIVEELKYRICALTIPQRVITKETLSRNQAEGSTTENQPRSEVACCILLHKPLEKILIRYERIPSEFGTVIFPDGTQPMTAAKPPRPASTLVTTLSRYLHHRRWVWSASAHNHSLGLPAVSRILSTLTKMRLQEGFRVAHSAAGIINMVLEVQMKCCDEDMDHMCKNCRPCIIQYVLFPVHVTNPVGKGSSSDEEATDEGETTDTDSSMELIAECWIEPQHGVVAKGPEQRSYMEALPYHQLADAMWRNDAECISNLLTFEHIRLMCQNPDVLPPLTMDPLQIQPQNPLENWPDAVALSDQRIHRIPFAYNLLNILPKCQQVELQFSMFIQEILGHWETKNTLDAPNNLLMETLFSHLKELHDKELYLNAIESKHFVDLIMKRNRDVNLHPFPFPRRLSRDIEKNKISDQDNKESAEKILANNDWPKILPGLLDDELLGGNDEETGAVKQTFSNQPSPKENKDQRADRKSCGPLYRMYQKVPSKIHSERSSDAEPNTPRWKCFIKGITPTHCILTFIPASFQDVKHLMLGAEPKMFTAIPQSESLDDSLHDECVPLDQVDSEKQLVIESSLNPEAAPFVPLQSFVERTEKQEKDPLSSHSSLSNRGWIVDTLDGTDTTNIFETLPSSMELHNNSSWELSNRNLDPGSPFRLRASSWEPIKQQCFSLSKRHVIHRSQARSVGSKKQLWAEHKFKRKSMYQGDTASVHSSDVQNTAPLKPFLGALSVPIYVYDCPLGSLLDIIVLKSECVRNYEDHYMKRMFKSDGERGFHHTETDNFEIPELKSDDSDSAQDELDVWQHCRMVTQAYNKSFVVSLFKSLHLGQNINTLNVKMAVDECEEASVEINITDYIQTVCGHLKDMKNQCTELANREELGPGTDIDTRVPLSLFRTPGSCAEYKRLHQLIKNKFLHIITTCFKAVPSHPDFYFCSPNWERERLADVSHDVAEEGPHILDNAQEYENIHFHSEMVEFPSDHAASPWEALGSVTTPDDARTSLLSNMDSDSVSDFPEDDTDEDISPLFLHLICSVRSVGKTGTSSVRILPTCLGELMESLDFSETHIDLRDIDVTLNVVCLTLPLHSEKYIQPSEAAARTLSPACALDSAYPPQQNLVALENHFPESGLADKLQHLPDYQHKAVTNCVEEIKWLMRDEIAAFLLDASPVTEVTLQLVANHVASSTGRPSCLMEVVTLHFVFGPEQSLPKFLQEFLNMRVPGYCLKKENELYYLVKDKKCVHRDSQDSDSLAFNHPDSWNQSAGILGYSESGLIDARLREVFLNLLSNSATVYTFLLFFVTGDDLRTNFGSPTSYMGSSDIRSYDLDQKRGSTGWSSIAAWHSELSNLMESGLIAEEGYEAATCQPEDSSDWLTELEMKRPEFPNFWLIMKVNQDSVTTYFHCRFLDLETEEVKTYRRVQRNVINNIRQLCKMVNQTMLLHSLHDTRMCNQLLEPECNDDMYKANQSLTPQRSKIVEDTSERADISGGYSDAAIKFMPGWFACKVVWETHFSLHPRLKTGPGKPGLSRGIQALRTVLNRFSVNNRKNMFVYQDHSGNVFYLRLHENTRFQVRTTDDDNSPSSVSRSSSINSLNNANNKKTDEQQKDTRPRVKSFGETGDGLNTRQEDFLTLNVHGISEAGPEVKNELVQVLQNRLDDAVLEVVSVMLARNPMCKLSPDDVHFIQKPNTPPESIILFTVQPYALGHLQAVGYYLRQNLLQFLNLPKYTDARSQYHFQDYSQPEDSGRRVNESNLFLYNQSPASGNKGIACIALALVDSEGNLIQCREYSKPNRSAYKEHILMASQFQSLTATNIYEPSPGKNLPGPEVLIEFRVWKQGRVNIESLSQKLKAAVRHTFWDLLLETNLLTAPLSTNESFNLDTEESDEEICSDPLNKVYQEIMAPWMQFGSKLGVPAVRTHVVTLTHRHSVTVTLKEVLSLVTVHDTKGFVYYLRGKGENAQFLPYNWNENLELPSSTTCLLISRNIAQWKACLCSDPGLHVDKLDPKAQKVLQKFPPLLETSFGETTQFASRQRFLLAVVTSEKNGNHQEFSKKVILHIYNWAKDLVEVLTKQMGNLGLWLSARSNLLTGIIAQKMGLFHNQPCTRRSQPGNPYMTHIPDVESLVTFPGAPRFQRTSAPNVGQMVEVLRDTKAVIINKKSVSTDHVVSNAQQLLDTKTTDKRDHQKKLYTMWQTRGATPNIPLAEDILELFIQHSRVIHYCLTPLLFLHRWRIQSAATRDHSLKVYKSHSQASLMDAVPKFEPKWHVALCANFIHEYKQYLQTLGFIPIQTGPATPRKGSRSGSKMLGRECKTRFYLQKSLLGGILLFEIRLCEPFFHTKLHALECFRLEGKSSSALISQFTLSFLDECDKIKVLMHLHSFTYDYHLRCLHWFITDRQQIELLRPGYHLTSFLDDFMKYYSKAPNYARNLVHAGYINVSDIAVPARQLFSYLLSHEKIYEMHVFRMVPPDAENEEGTSAECEYVLVQLSNTRLLTYKDAQDNKQTDDFDVTLIIAHKDMVDPNILTLHYYILLISRREPYPKLEIERKIGKFCTVTTPAPTSVAQPHQPTICRESSTEELADQFPSSSPTIKKEYPAHFEIRPESVNYLGYYSSHEQLMQQLILEQAEACCQRIRSMISQSSLHCRTHILWNKLLSSSVTSSASSSSALASSSASTLLSYGELCELRSLADVQAMTDVDPRLAPMLCQPVSWYQALIKLLIVKYADHYRIFTSPDSNIQHLLILHPRLLEGFVMLTVDTHLGQGDFSIVSRKPLSPSHEVSKSDLHTLVEDTVNACCFHLWVGLL